MKGKQYFNTLQRGMTLIELSVVLLILSALAGLAVPYVGGIGSTAACQTTDATMQAVKQAIMGGAAGAGFYGDTLGQFPRDRYINTVEDKYAYSLHYLFTRDDGANTNATANSTDGGKTNVDPVDEWPAYNAKTGVGWRGPYLNTGGQLAAANLHGSFSDEFIPGSNLTGKVHVSHNDVMLTQVFDAWRRPIILQIPYYDLDGAGTTYVAAYHPENARLVSAGQGNGLESGDAEIDTKIQTPDASDRGDDRVLFLKIPDPKPGGNRPCDEN